MPSSGSIARPRLSRGAEWLFWWIMYRQHLHGTWAFRNWKWSYDTRLITVSQAWNSLQQRRTTATGPDDIQYTVWRDHGALLAPVITMVWNLSLKTHTWRRAGKKSNIIPLSKVDLLKEKNRLSWHKRYFRHCEGFWRDRVKKAQLSLRIGKGVAVRTSLNLA